MPAAPPPRVPPLAPLTPWETLAKRSSVGLFHLLARTLFRCRVADVPLLPEGPAIVAPNHRSFLDSLIVGSLLGGDVFFMMHAKYYDMPLLHWFFVSQRCIVVEEGETNRRALRQSLEVLEAGRHLVIFPEGVISPDGELQPAQPGMGWLARRTGAPIYPVYLGGTREALPKGSARLRLHPLVVRGGPPVSMADMPPGRAGEDALTAAVMEAIARMEHEERAKLRRRAGVPAGGARRGGSGG